MFHLRSKGVSVGTCARGAPCDASEERRAGDGKDPGRGGGRAGREDAEKSDVICLPGPKGVLGHLLRGESGHLTSEA